MAGILQQPNDPADQDKAPTAYTHPTRGYPSGGPDHGTSTREQVDRLQQVGRLQQVPKNSRWEHRLEPSGTTITGSYSSAGPQGPTNAASTKQSTRTHTHSVTSHPTGGPGYEWMGATYTATSSAANYGDQSSGEASSDTSSGCNAESGRGPVEQSSSSSRFCQPIRLVHGGFIPGSGDKETASATNTQ